MDSLIINKTEDSPQITFDTTTNRFEISGESRPENAGKFYGPVIKWITDFESILYWRKNESTNHSKVTFVFKLDYFNSTSAKYIADIISIIKKLVSNDYKIDIEWHYDKRDDDMLDAGKEFAEIYDFNFNFIEY